MWEVIVSVPDHCLSFYMGSKQKVQTYSLGKMFKQET